MRASLPLFLLSDVVFPPGAYQNLTAPLPKIYQTRLVEGRDDVLFSRKGERAIGGTVRVEYHLTIDAAKHIAMMSVCDPEPHP